MAKFHDLDFKKQPDGGIRLEQQYGVDDPNIIDLHPEQVLFIARSICGMKPETAGQVAELERRIAVLTDKLQNLVCDKAFRVDLIERCGDGFEYLARMDALLDLAMEFDGGRLKPEYKPDDAGEAKPIYPCSAIDQAKKTQPRTIAGGGKQLGLNV